jgi:hypothetical protein
MKEKQNTIIFASILGVIALWLVYEFMLTQQGGVFTTQIKLYKITKTALLEE